MIVLSYAPEDITAGREVLSGLPRGRIKTLDGQPGPPAWSALGTGLSLTIRRCDILIIFLSRHSVDKHGLLRKELINALSDWDEKEADDVYVVLVRLEACKVPDHLRNFRSLRPLMT